MWKSILFLSVAIGLLGCTTQESDRIAIPKIQAGYYQDAFSQINDKLSSDPKNLKLINQKLVYCEQLEWPSSCLDALDASRQVNGMINKLVRQYIEFYSLYEYYDALVSIFDKWGSEYQLNDEFAELFIHSLVKTNARERAISSLRDYAKSHQTPEDLAFIATHYLELDQSTLALYNLGKLRQLDSKHELMWRYGLLLNEIGYSELGLDVVDSYVQENTDDSLIQIAYARMLEGANQDQKARVYLKPFITQDTISYLLADWYLKVNEWDSARFILTDVIEEDPTNRTAIWKVGRLFEERGWFSSSLEYYNQLIELNPQDSLAINRIDLIQRKIAYLQRLKFEESKLPLQELKPKKIIQ